MAIGEHTGSIGDSSRVQKIWEIAQKLMHRLTTRDLPPDAISGALIMCCYKRQGWFWKFSDPGREGMKSRNAD